MAKESSGAALAGSASTWMQVVFGGLGLSVAIVGAVIAYFAWVQPHSSGDGEPGGDKPAAVVGMTAPAAVASRPGATAAAPKAIPLGSLEASTGGGNVHPAGADLTMPCATGQTTDRQRTVDYDLSGHYTALTGGLTVTKAHDTDTALQVTVFLDDHQIDVHNLTKGGTAGLLDVPLTGGNHLRLQLICQLPDGEVRLDDPTLTHA
jgi:hypothetical protein